MWALIGILFVIILATLLACIGLGLAYFKSKQKSQLRAILRKAEASPAEQRNQFLLRSEESDDALANLLRRFKFTDQLDLLLDQAGQDWSSSKLVLLSLIAASAGLLVGLRLSLFGSTWSATLIALLAGSVPLLSVLRKRAKAIALFEEQLPEALDFLSRSMRAGHGFSIALEMLAADSPDPLGAVFRRVSNDIHLGSSLEVALGKLVSQVPLVDVRFFVSSVVLQQETGGNLGEILSKLADIIRERFRLRGAVKAAAAHGKITGLVLILMPVGVTLFLLMTNPSYLAEMFANPIGKWMVYGACAAQVTGYFVIRKIIDIKV